MIKVLIEAEFKIPKDRYSIHEIGYVTAENWIRCISQASALLVYYGIENNLMDINLSPEDFKDQYPKGKFYYHTIGIKFKRKTPVNDTFNLSLLLSDCKSIAKFDREFTIFLLNNSSKTKEDVKSQVSFVYEGGK